LKGSLVYIEFCIVICGQYEAWSVGRPRRHAKRRGGKVAEAGQAEGKEAVIEIVDNHVCLSVFALTHLYI